jgi:ABC-type branched-subunit amino acid transport system substrate-binding protein
MRKRLIGLMGICLLILVLVYTPGSIYGAAKEVIYLSLADYTGPSAGLDAFIQTGTEDFFKYVNDKGGVQGVKIKFIGVDTRADVARVVAGYKRYRRNPKVLAFWNNSSPSNKVIIPLATRDKLVMLTPASGEAVAKPGIAFCWGQTYQDGFAGSVDWMVQDWKKKGNTGLPTIGYMNLDNGYGRAHMQGGKEYAERKGVKLFTEFFNPGIPDYTTYLTRLKECNYIYVGGVDPNPTNAIRDAHRLGMTKTTQFVCDYWGPSRGSGMGIAAHPEVVQGVVVVSFHLRGKLVGEHPLVKEVWTRYHKEPLSEVVGGYAGGFTLGGGFVEALKIALNEVGYKKLRKENIYKAYQKLEGNKFAQGIQTPCTYNVTERRGSKGIRFYRVKDLDLIPITDWVFPPDAVSLHKF